MVGMEFALFLYSFDQSLWCKVHHLAFELSVSRCLMVVNTLMPKTKFCFENHCVLPEARLRSNCDFHEPVIARVNNTSRATRELLYQCLHPFTARIYPRYEQFRASCATPGVLSRHDLLHILTCHATVFRDLDSLQYRKYTILCGQSKRGNLHTFIWALSR